MSFWNAHVSPFLKDAEIVARLLALATGATWAYFKFAKGRVFRPRLELTVECTSTSNHDVDSVLIVYKIKNVGLSRIDIFDKGSGLRVFALELPSKSQDILSAVWKHKATFKILSRHTMIEAGETIIDDKLIHIPQGELPIRVELLVSSTTSNTWVVSCVALALEEE